MKELIDIAVAAWGYFDPANVREFVRLIIFAAAGASVAFFILRDRAIKSLRSTVETLTIGLTDTNQRLEEVATELGATRKELKRTQTVLEFMRKQLRKRGCDKAPGCPNHVELVDDMMMETELG